MTTPYRDLIEQAGRDAGSDLCLLDRFVHDRDGLAFAELVRRYGPMVLSVCRRVLHDGHLVEDGFQATFLALISRPPKRLSNESLAGWLYLAAGRISTKMLVRSRKSAGRERRVARTESTMSSVPGNGDLAVAIDEELARLPETYRLAVVLCCVLEKPFVEAGRELGLSASAVRKRVQRGREVMQKRLGKRGFAPTAAGIGLGCLAVPSTAAVPQPLIGLTLRLAEGLLDGSTESIPSNVLEGARTISRRSTGTWAILGVACSLLVGVSIFAVASPRESPRPPSDRVSPDGVRPTPTAAIPVPLAEFAGRVVDSSGKPIPFAIVVAHAKEFRRGETGASDRTIADVRTDADGKFRIAIPPFSATVIEDRRVKLLAITPDGRTCGGIQIPIVPGVKTAPIELSFGRAQALSGRAIDSAGNPVAGARVTVIRLGSSSWEPVEGAGSEPPLGWPKPVETDSFGNFEIGGVDLSEGLRLTVSHPVAGFTFASVGEKPPTPFVVAFGPSKRLDVRVVAADSGEPLGHSRLVVLGSGKAGGLVGRKALTSGNGAASVSLPEARVYELQVFPPEGTPYPAVARRIEWKPNSSGVQDLVVAVSRGVVVTGRVAERGRGVPLAHVQWMPRSEANPHASLDTFFGGPAVQSTDDEGRFAIAALPGPGTILVHGPSLNYVPVRTDIDTLNAGRPGGRAVYAHAVVSVDLPSAGVPKPIEATIAPAQAIECSVVDPEGGAIESGSAICRHLSNPRNLMTPASVPIANGKLILPGCEAGRRYFPVAVDAGLRWAAATELDTPVAGAPNPVLKLERTARLDTALASSDGEPVEGVSPQLMMMIPASSPAGEPANLREADPIPAVWYSNGTRTSGPVSGRDGRITLTGLTPNARYQFGLGGAKWTPLLDFSPKPGERVRVPTVLLGSTGRPKPRGGE